MNRVTLVPAGKGLAFAFLLSAAAAACALLPVKVGGYTPDGSWATGTFIPLGYRARSGIGLIVRREPSLAEKESGELAVVQSLYAAPAFVATALRPRRRWASLLAGTACFLFGHDALARRART